MSNQITYFEKEGVDNTDDLINIVKERLEESTIKNVVIASASGESAMKLADALNDDINIINVTHHAGFNEPNSLDISEEMIEKLEERGIPTVIASHALSGVGRGITNKYGGYSPIDIIADTLCAEISIMAADAGLIPVGEEVLAIGGRAKGVDSAAILTPANMTGVFDLRFHEILAMPRP